MSDELPNREQMQAAFTRILKSQKPKKGLHRYYIGVVVDCGFEPDEPFSEVSEILDKAREYGSAYVLAVEES